MYYTMGPWKVVKQRGVNGAVTIGIDAGTKHWVAKIPEDTEFGFPREEANARLIAASPTLLKFLKEYVSHDACSGEEPHNDCLRCDALEVIEQVEKE